MIVSVLITTEMEELIKEALNKYFSDFKEYQIIIMISFFVILALLQLLQTIYISKNVEKFKNALKKSEIKFSRYHDLQVEALRSIYQKLVLFDYANGALFNNKYEHNDHTHFKANITEWNKLYWECIKSFHADKILLPEDLKELVEKTISEFEEVRDILLKERHNLDELEYEYQGNMEWMYDYSENELEIINKKLANLRTRGIIVKSQANIRALRKSIEGHFAQMNA